MPTLRDISGSILVLKTNINALIFEPRMTLPLNYTRNCLLVSVFHVDIKADETKESSSANGS